MVLLSILVCLKAAIEIPQEIICTLPRMRGVLVGNLPFLVVTFEEIHEETQGFKSLLDFGTTRGFERMGWRSRGMFEVTMRVESVPPIACESGLMLEVVEGAV